MKKLYATTLRADIMTMGAGGIKNVTGTITTITVAANASTDDELFQSAMQSALEAARKQMPEDQGWTNHNAQLFDIDNQTLANYLFL